MKNQKHGYKMIAPIVITAIVVLYYFVYFGVLIHLVGGVPGFLLGLIPVLLAATMIYVCVQRINEIRSGEEDDLSNY
ncbi:MAG: hypothetical protein Q4B26_05330 [Eubacteriales bacterium]|nr:hypothetical protein [Eubacteriales bacterium]